MKINKRNFALLLTVLTLATLTGCAYGGISVAGGNTVVITKNDGLLFGLMRQIYVCKVTTNGVKDCKSAEAP